MPELKLIIEGTANLAEVALAEAPITIGRHSSNKLVLDDQRSSRAHAVIEAVGDQFRLRDLNSSNGTFLNGQRVIGSVLKPNDIVTIGAVRMKVIDATPVEELGLEDIVEEIVEVKDSERIDLGGMIDADYEDALLAIAGSLPEGEFGENEIALVNAKGKVSHEAVSAPRRTGARREVVEVFRLILLCAFRSATTDIHLEPRKEGYVVRLRIDGTLVDAAKMPHQFGVKVASLVKVLGEIDLAQRDSIQEGSYSVRVPSSDEPSGFRRVDYRVSFAPTVFGQKLVLRVLDTANAPLKLQNLALPTWMAKELAAAIANDAGMVLVAGPTGSGKTTTLYALVRSIDVHQRNVVTIEDPVEIQIENVSQMPVNDEQGKSFSNILRSVLRQDPDVILVGEIRDAETARIAMQAAITGHLVFSTVHTKDTAGTIFRLLDLGVEPYMISQGLHMVIAQRLVRLLCPHCKKGRQPTHQELARLGPKHVNVPKLFDAVGCKKCLGTGHIGRRSVSELLTMNDALRNVIQRSPTINDIHEAMKDTSFVSLVQNGYDLAAKGLVSMQEVERTVGK
jgi:general secretion pathway protein E